MGLLGMTFSAAESFGIATKMQADGIADFIQREGKLPTPEEFNKIAAWSYTAGALDMASDVVVSGAGKGIGNVIRDGTNTLENGGKNLTNTMNNDNHTTNNANTLNNNTGNYTATRTTAGTRTNMTNTSTWMWILLAIIATTVLPLYSTWMERNPDCSF